MNEVERREEMNEEGRREELYVACFIKFLDAIIPGGRSWDSLGKKFEEALGLPITSGLGMCFKGFVCGMEAAARATGKIGEYSKGGCN